MDQGTIAYWLTWVGTGAWVVCFWWMHRISTRQDALLTELQELARPSMTSYARSTPMLVRLKSMSSRGSSPLNRLSLPNLFRAW